MNRNACMLLLVPALALAACGRAQPPPPAAPAAPAAPVAHVEHMEPAAAAAGIAQTAPAGQRWLADAPLRAGMAKVRTATNALGHLEHGHLDRGQVLALADEIQSAVNGMFAQCKLAPEADAALHPLLARLLADSQALRTAPIDSTPVADLREVLARYAQLFDDGESVIR